MGQLRIEGITVTHEELLEVVDFLPLAGMHAWMQPALRAVVELHKPNEFDFCEHCWGEEEGVGINYPCLTIQAIEKELQ